MKRGDQRTILEIAIAIRDTEIYPTEPDHPVHPHTFDKYMLEEEETVADGVSIGPVSREERKGQYQSAVAYLMAKPLWEAVLTLSEGSTELAPEQVVALQLHPTVLDHLIAHERWHQQACLKNSEEAESDFRREDEAKTARDFAIAARRFELMKDDFASLCKKLGITPKRNPERGR